MMFSVLCVKKKTQIKLNGMNQTWFDISVHDILGVDVIKSRAQTSHIEGNICFLEDKFLLQIVSQISSCLEIKCQVARLLIVECAMEFDDKWMLKIFESSQFICEHLNASFML
jgi:hypothetical protein